MTPELQKALEEARQELASLRGGINAARIARETSAGQVPVETPWWRPSLGKLKAALFDPTGRADVPSDAYRGGKDFQSGITGGLADVFNYLVGTDTPENRAQEQSVNPMTSQLVHGVGAGVGALLPLPAKFQGLAPAGLANATADELVGMLQQRVPALAETGLGRVAAHGAKGAIASAPLGMSETAGQGGDLRDQLLGGARAAGLGGAVGAGVPAVIGAGRAAMSAPGALARRLALNDPVLARYAEAQAPGGALPRGQGLLLPTNPNEFNQAATGALDSMLTRDAAGRQARIERYGATANAPGSTQPLEYQGPARGPAGARRGDGPMIDVTPEVSPPWESEPARARMLLPARVPGETTPIMAPHELRVAMKPDPRTPVANMTPALLRDALEGVRLSDSAQIMTPVDPVHSVRDSDILPQWMADRTPVDPHTHALTPVPPERSYTNLSGLTPTIAASSPRAEPPPVPAAGEYAGPTVATPSKPAPRSVEGAVRVPAGFDMPIDKEALIARLQKEKARYLNPNDGEPAEGNRQITALFDRVIDRFNGIDSPTVAGALRERQGVGRQADFRNPANASEGAQAARAAYGAIRQAVRDADTTGSLRKADDEFSAGEKHAARGRELLLNTRGQVEGGEQGPAPLDPATENMASLAEGDDAMMELIDGRKRSEALSPAMRRRATALLTQIGDDHNTNAVLANRDLAELHRHGHGPDLDRLQAQKDYLNTRFQMPKISPAHVLGAGGAIEGAHLLGLPTGPAVAAAALLGGGRAVLPNLRPFGAMAIDRGAAGPATRSGDMPSWLPEFQRLYAAAAARAQAHKEAERRVGR